MQNLHFAKNHQFLSIIGILFILQLCLYLQDTPIKPAVKSIHPDTLALISPKKYLISELAPLFSNWQEQNTQDVTKNINQVLEKLDVNAYIINDSIKHYGRSFEFLIYVNKYNRAFPVRYTPLINNLSELINLEKFSLEIKPFSTWIPLPLERLLG